MNRVELERLEDAEHKLMLVADRLRNLSVGASRLFQAGLANELEALRALVNEGRSGMRGAVDALLDARVKDAEQASANVVNTALAMAKAVFGASEDVT